MLRLSPVYAQDLMRTRLLASLLVLLLSGADSGATAICAAYCTSSASAEGGGVHHHQMKSNSQQNPTSVSHHTHSHHRGALCAECPSVSQYSLNQKANCANLVQVQALKESSLSLDTPHRVAQIDFVDAPAPDRSLAVHPERYLVSDASQKVKSSNPASVPLRI